MQKQNVEKAGEELFNFAIDREDIKTLMAYLPEEAKITRSTVEYELQILKIVMVGWSISYFLEKNPHKNSVGAHYWKAVNDFSRELSSQAGLIIGRDIDYFQVLKERLDNYLDAVVKKPGAPEPAVVIGPEFARICGNETDIYTVMTGSRMVIAVTANVKSYLDARGIEQEISSRNTE